MTSTARLAAIVLAASFAGMLGGCGAEEEEATGRSPEPPEPAMESGWAHHFDVQRVATGLNRPTFVGAAPGDLDALWVLEQPGRVVRLEGDRARTVLDLSARVTTGAEQGLLGIAFHPGFAQNRRLFLHWSGTSGETRVAEFRAGADGVIDPEPVQELLRVDQPEENHNGGHLAFGPDERLYLGLGDGGGAFDPHRTAQDDQTLLGKIVATDVSTGTPRWEPVVTGLRNPWRFWFDLGLGELWIGDVGQDRVEEVNRVALELDEPPKNLGWSAFEGTEPVRAGDDLDPRGELVFPVAAYKHGNGECSITGGPVYGGTALSMTGRYVYGDFCSGNLWTLRGTPAGGATDVRRERARVPQLTHIGTDADGELVLASASGAIYRAAAPR